MSGELMAKIRHDNVNHMIALTCAPLLAGMKVSNLYLAEKSDFMSIAGALEGTGISAAVLSENGSRTAVLLYDPRRLQKYLERKDTAAFLKRMGYVRTDTVSVLRRLSERYRAYSENKMLFPHELGVLLGYPVGDVYGFMKNNGKNYILSGYWKVYTRPERASRIFRKYEAVTEIVVRHAVDGKTVRDIVGGYKS